MKTNRITYLGYVLIAASLAICAVVIYINDTRKYVPLVFSDKAMLDSLWQHYKDYYLEKGTYRTVDWQRGEVTTSEGEAYTMLRSVWQDDHATFDASWTWLNDNLAMKDSHIYSWLFGRRTDGTYGIMTSESGQNAASDADTDIALALLFAYARWDDPRYLNAAKLTINDIWNHEVIVIRNTPYMTSDNIEKNFKGDVAINPSYFSPYAYKIFATVDPAHDWNALVDSSYSLLEASSVADLNTAKSDMLPPDWILIDRNTGAIKTSVPGLDTNFSYDAMRVPWRVALDWYWNNDPRAYGVLSSMSFLENQWNHDHMLVSDYSHDGSAVASNESPAFYGGSIAAFMVIDANTARQVYEEKLQSLYSPDSNSWKKLLGYYDDNWAWFGMALYNGMLPNLWDKS